MNRIARNPEISAALVALGLALGAAYGTGLLGAVFGGVDLTQSISPGNWMAWTWAGATFFGIIACLLVAMTLWQAFRPQAPRTGILGIETTPGDRLFISLLGSAFINLAWLGLMGPPLWVALALSLVYAAAVFRWV